MASLAIRRPLLILVINLLIALAGAAALLGVEVRELPNVDRPVVMVRANFPGAAPETVDAEATSIVERAVARVNGVKSIRSSSEENNFRIRMTFTPDSDLEVAATDVREAVSRVQRRLPAAIEQLTVTKADADASPIVRISVVSARLTREELSRKVENDVIPALITLGGVADVTVFGDRRRLLRVVLDPLRLTSYGLSVSDVSEVLNRAAFDAPAGSFQSLDQELIVRADATAVTPKAVADLLIRPGVRIRDVANVYFGPKDPESISRLGGREVIGLNVIRQANSNTIEISDGVRAAVERMNERFDDIELVITADDAIFIKGSVREVLITLGFAVMIVIGTIWLFIGSARATLVPAAAIPIALIGSVAAIWLLGFSINILTLLGLVLATGMIVDDSIVVLENVQRRKAQGLASRAAALLGTRQVFFAVIATTLTLISVFVPISFLQTTAGRLFQEFGFVLAAAVAISSFVALTLAPALAARLPDSVGRRREGPLTDFGRFLSRGYERSLDWSLRAPLVILAAIFVFGGFALVAYHTLDEELVPPEDRGTLFVFGTGPDGVGLNYTARQADRIEDILQPYIDSGEIRTALTIVGRFDLNRLLVIAPLAPWDERDRHLQTLVRELRGKVRSIPGMRISVFGRNSLGVRGARGGLDTALLGNNYKEIFEAAQLFARAVEDRSADLSDPDISYQPTQPQLSVAIDRQRAADLGVDLDDVAATLRAMVDGDELVDLNIDDEAVPVFLESALGAINDPGDLANLFVRSSSGALVPLSSLATLTEEGVAAELDRSKQRRAIDVDFDLTPGFPLRAAVEEVQAIADEVLPPGIEMILQGQAETLDETSRDVLLTYAVAILVVFLVLAAQFESVMSAAVVMTTVPFGIAAAVYALLLTDTSINVYSQIGVLMLIGLMAKNGILVVEFADQLRDRGMAVQDAVRTAAKVRLRPIAMTMISTVVGGLPLILSTGPGAEARSAIGWVVFGGLAIAGVVTLYLTPVAYLGLARFAKPRAAEAERLDRELDEAESIEDADILDVRRAAE